MAELNVTLPYNLEAEQSVLGSILIDNKCMADANLYLRADYFYLPQHKAIYSAMDYQFMNNGGAIDPVIIADALTKDGKYDLAGGKEYLMQLANVVPSTANIEKYAKIVQEQYYLRNLIQVSQSLLKMQQVVPALQTIFLTVLNKEFMTSVRAKQVKVLKKSPMSL